LLIHVCLFSFPGPTNLYQATSQSKFPIPHTSPEALASSQFGPLNDIWSFGITMYEILEDRGNVI